MFLDLLPELLSPILTLLNRKDLKNVSLCSKECNLIVAPMLWESVVVTESLLLTTTPIPNQIALCRDLSVQVRYIMNGKERNELVNKFEALMTLCSPTTIRFASRYPDSLTQCLKAICKDDLGHLTRLKNLFIDYKVCVGGGLKYLSCLTGLRL